MAPQKTVATRPLVMSLWTLEGTARETLYYAHDLCKNVVSLFDAKGLRRTSYQYDPFGNITFMEGDMAESNPFRFSSEHHDEDLGLVYYNPTDGRRISRDPIAEKGGWTLYGFVGNHPLFSYDEKGLTKNANNGHILTVVASIQWRNDNKGLGGKEGIRSIGQWDAWIVSPSISREAYCCHGILKFPQPGNYLEGQNNGYKYTMAAAPQYNGTDESSGKIDFVSTLNDENTRSWEVVVTVAVSAAMGSVAAVAVASTGVGAFASPDAGAAATIMSLHMGGPSEDQSMWGVSCRLSCHKLQNNPTGEQLRKPSGYWGAVGSKGISNRATMVGRGTKIG